MSGVIKTVWEYWEMGGRLNRSGEIMGDWKWLGKASKKKFGGKRDYKDVGDKTKDKTKKKNRLFNGSWLFFASVS